MRGMKGSGEGRRPEDGAIEKVLGRHWFGSVKLGRGVVGKSTVAIASVMAVLLTIALRISTDWMLLMLGAVAVVAFIVYLLVIFFLARKHPEAALLEGAELVHWAQINAGGTKDAPAPPPANPIPDPTRLPPAIIDIVEPEVEPKQEGKELPDATNPPPSGEEPKS